MASLHVHPPLLYTAGVIWPPVCIAVVAARIATRNAQRMKLGLDDWLMVPALVLDDLLFPLAPFGSYSHTDSSKLLVLGMAATILAGTAQHALGHSTPKPIPGTELTATSPQQTVTRKVISIPSPSRPLLDNCAY
jgi:hypothetical protein